MRAVTRAQKGVNTRPKSLPLIEIFGVAAKDWQPCLICIHQHHQCRDDTKDHMKGIPIRKSEGEAIRAFERSNSLAFKRPDWVRRRLSDALNRNARFSIDDRILVVSQSIELVLEKRRRRI